MDKSYLFNLILFSLLSIDHILFDLISFELTSFELISGLLVTFLITYFVDLSLLFDTNVSLKEKKTISENKNLQDIFEVIF